MSSCTMSGNHHFMSSLALLTEATTFMARVLHFNIMDNCSISALPYLPMLLIGSHMSWLVDWVLYFCAVPGAAPLLVALLWLAVGTFSWNALPLGHWICFQFLQGVKVRRHMRNIPIMISCNLIRLLVRDLNVGLYLELCGFSFCWVSWEGAWVI